MNHGIKLLALTLLFSALSISASARKFKSYQDNNKEVSIRVNGGTYVISPISKKIVHIEFLQKRRENKDFSYGAIAEPGNVSYSVTETSDSLYIKTEGIEVHIGKKPFEMQFFYNGKLLLSDVEGFERKKKMLTTELSISEDEILFGGGARVLGMNRRGNNLQLYNCAHYGYETHSELMNYTIPMFISSKKYAVLFDNASIGWLDLDSEGENEVEYETVSGTINYYVIADDDWYGLTEAYTSLTGRQPMPPRWAFGNFSSRFGYHSQEEVLNTIEKFNEDEIPVDAAIIDIYWFGKGIFDEMGNLEWYRDSFPEPKRMISKLENQGVKTILVTEPFILTTSNRWEEAVENDVLATDKKGNPYTYDFYFGNTGLIDIFDPLARDWFWNIYKEFTMQGIGGWWGDLGEPEVHPSDLQHINGSADEVHNAYGHEWGKMIYKGYQKDFPEQRPFILMRAGFAGSQRYGMIPWTGDVNRTWGGLYSQPEISLQMGMQGLAYMHSDLGGFAGGDTIDNELYIRWLQYGVFQPIYRPHAQEHIPAEPVFQIDSTKAHAKAAIVLRYKLLPYIYNMAHENHVSGKPLMIPLFYEFPDNKHLLTYDSAYLWGDAFLVAPIKQPGVNEMQVYLPEGKSWTHFNSNQIFQGGRYVTVPVTIDHIPVFVKSGSFIPMSTTTGNTSKYNIDVLEMHYYVDKGEHAYSMYHDDGVTPDAEEKGLSTTISFKAGISGDVLKLTSGSDKESNSLIQWFIHNVTDEPVAITDGSGKPMEFSWDSDKNLIKIDTAAAINSEVNILLQKK